MFLHCDKQHDLGAVAFHKASKKVKVVSDVTQGLLGGHIRFFAPSDEKIPRVDDKQSPESLNTYAKRREQRYAGARLTQQTA